MNIRLQQQTSLQSDNKEGSGRRREGRVTVLTGAQLGGGASVDSDLEPLPANENLSFVAEDEDEGASF